MTNATQSSGAVGGCLSPASSGVTSQLKHNVVANLIGRVWAAALGLAFVPIYVKLLGIEAYGLVGFYVTLQAVFTVLDMGFSTTMNRELARMSIRQDTAGDQRDLLRTLETLYWLSSAFIALLALALAPIIASHWVNPEHLSVPVVTSAVRMTGLVIALQFPFALYQGGLMGLQRQVQLNYILIAAATVRGAGIALVLWLVSPTIVAFFACQMLVSAGQTVFGGWLLWRRVPRAEHRPRFQKTLLTQVWRFAAGTAGISALGVLLMQLDKVILSKTLPLETLGYYMLSTSVAASLGVVGAPLFTAVFPRFTQMVSLDDRIGISALYHRACQALSVVLIPAGLLLAVFSTEILRAWTGNPAIVANAHLLVTLLATGYLLNALMNVPYALQLAHGWTKLTFHANLAAAIILVPAIVGMSYRYAGVGAASVWIILNAGYVLFVIRAMHRKLLVGEQWQWYYSDVGLPLLAAGVCIGLGRWLIPKQATTPVTLACLGATFALAVASSGLAAPLTRNWLLTRLRKGCHPIEA